MARPKPAPKPVDPEVVSETGTEAEGYTVVARRYRPQRFEDVVGQDHIVRALRNAITLNRVTHAYLFSGTRGVGKTSMARIFAKCLNCVRGPTAEPCLTCDICRAIAAGQDVDVIEIDGASNNGVEAVRELRQNASLRPSRAQTKIYYIDEVHMLSAGAFNALLKTLEEPPEHVKFLFATTEPNKIPITVLSRCQRYDFAPIAPDRIVDTLADICAREGIEVEPEALQTVARRAGGSMRDAQSLLEQLLSSGGERLTVERVHALLGTASDERILDLIDALSRRDPGEALRLLDAAVGAGIPPADLLNGCLDFARDVMVVAAGAGSTLLAATPRQRPRLEEIAGRWPLETVLAALQVLAEARGRLRGSPHGRLVVEMALVRVARLEDLDELSGVIERLAALEGAGPGTSPPPRPASAPTATAPPPPPPAATTAAGGGAVKKKPPAPDGLTSPSPEDAAAVPEAVGRKRAQELTLGAVQDVWPRVLEKVGVQLGAWLSLLRPTAISGPDLLVIGVPAGYNWVVEKCDTGEGRDRIQAALRSLLGDPIGLRFEPIDGADGPAAPDRPAAPAVDEELRGDPWVRRTLELFEARCVRLESGAAESGDPP